MSITLISNDILPLREIGDHLIRQGVGEISLVEMEEIIHHGKTLDQAGLVIVISTSQDIVYTGDKVRQIRQKLSSGQKLLLCMPRPTDPQTLQKQGADEIINLTGLSVERIVEHILGYLILDKRLAPHMCDELYGATRQMHELYRDIERYAPLKKESVLILGETGTGKRLIAQALHNKSGLKGNLTTINCAAFDPNLLRDELFGHLKGGFTGADHIRKGMIEEAQDGTAFIDEIGDLDLNSQIQLLEVLDTNGIQQIGSNIVREANARFVFATHRNLEERIGDNLFRPDLYARINILIIEVPPLRKRRADIPLLVERFVTRYNEKNETSVRVQPGAVDELFHYDWPLNVRELDGVVHRAAARAGVDGIITGPMLRESIRDPREFRSRRAIATQQSSLISVSPEKHTWPAIRDMAEATYFRLLIELAKNEKHAIELCGMKRAQLYEILRKYGLKFGR